MDKNFIRYFKDKGRLPMVILTLAIGALLILIGSSDGAEHEATEGIEERIAAACSEIEGVGECEVMVYRSSPDTEGEVVSVIVICDGGDSVEVRARLTSMLSSFFGIGANRIRIVQRAQKV